MAGIGGLFVGLLSGTSVDAIDAALLRIASDGTRLLGTLAVPIPADIKAELLHLSECDAAPIDRIGVLDRRFGVCLAEAVQQLLLHTNTPPQAVRAIGSHGQTIRHRPPRTDEPGFSWQIGDPHTIAEMTGICTVADFRRRDIAAGGQGAPLAPAFHQWAFSSIASDRIILNIGGMANISVLPAECGAVHGFDTGPGNALLDAWIRRHRDAEYDHDGAWARGGRVDHVLLARLRAHPYFTAPPPKSTGREEFNLAWIDSLQHAMDVAPQDVQATLTALTVTTICEAIEREIPNTGEVFVCGGGVHNSLLMERLAERLHPRPVRSTEALGIDPDWVEAALFAWLACQTLNSLPGNLPMVTGARHTVTLGSIHPGACTAGSD